MYSTMRSEYRTRCGLHDAAAPSLPVRGRSARRPRERPAFRLKGEVGRIAGCKIAAMSRSRRKRLKTQTEPSGESRASAAPAVERMTRRQRERELLKLYKQVPAMRTCKGKCADSCLSPFDVSPLERERIERLAGKRLVPGDGCRACSMLTANGRCSVYGARPMACRMFGAAPFMACEHGCEPERWLSMGEAIELIARSLELGGARDIPDVDMLRRQADENPDLLLAFIGMSRAMADLPSTVWSPAAPSAR